MYGFKYFVILRDAFGTPSNIYEVSREDSLQLLPVKYFPRKLYHRYLTGS